LKALLLKQALFIPLTAMLVPILLAFFEPGYSSISQHISDVALLDSPIAMIQRCAVIVTGASILLFGIGAFRLSEKRMWWTTAVAVIAGISLASNGVWVETSPLHGLYGLGGISMFILPAFFAAEIEQTESNRPLKQVSLLVSAVSLAYLWLMMSGFDPSAYRGLTQRLATVIYFGWYSFACYWLLYRDSAASSAHAASPVGSPAKA